MIKDVFMFFFGIRFFCDGKLLLTVFDDKFGLPTIQDVLAELELPPNADKLKGQAV